jgi:hypothetical protein
MRTGEVTSWTRCLSSTVLAWADDRGDSIQWLLTDIEQDCAIELLVHNVVLKDLIVEGLRATFGSRHRGVIKRALQLSETGERG